MPDKPERWPLTTSQALSIAAADQQLQAARQELQARVQIAFQELAEARGAAPETLKANLERDEAGKLAFTVTQREPSA